MRKVTRSLLWLFVFTVPWDVVALPLVGSVSRALGLAVIGAAALTTMAEARFRRPGTILWLAIAFAASSALSLLWTVSYESTLPRVLTYMQLVGSVWVVQEVARTEEQQQSLLAAFCLGAFIPLVQLLNNFRLGVQKADRFSVSGVNADDVGLMLVIGIPIAWHLMLRYSGAVRVVALTYCGLAPIAVLLTGTRGAFLAGVVAVSIVPLTLPRQSLRSLFIVTVLLVVGAAAVTVLVPSSSWARVSTIGQEIQSGQMSGRLDIWKAGASVFQERPLLGFGAGAYGPAVGPLLYSGSAVSHNVPLGVLVEQGIVGLCIFAALLGACARTIFRMPPPDRTFWAVLMLSWLVGVMSVNWELRKATWLLFGLLATQSAVATSRHISRSRREGVDTNTFARARRLGPVYSRPVAQRGANR